MPFNNQIQVIFGGNSAVTITFTPPPPPPPEPQAGTGKKVGTFLWTIHPKRRQNAVADRKLKTRPFRRLSINTDFRAWRRVVQYAGGLVLKLLRCEMTYGELEDTNLTYAQMEATGMTYGDLAECEVVIT